VRQRQRGARPTSSSVADGYLPRPPATQTADGKSMAPGLTLTGVGALLLLVGFGALGAVIDLLLGPVLGTATLVLLPTGTLAAGWLVRRGNLTTVLVAPPLVYLLLVVATLLVSTPGLGVAGVGAGLVYGFPAMAIATAVGIAVWALRRAAGR